VNIELKIQNLSVFMSVADTGSISQAARDEHLSQPAVSMIIASLENEFDLRFLQRKMRQRNPITLTPDGIIFRQYAQQFLELYSKLQIALLQNNDHHEEFSVGGGPSNSVFLLPMLIDSYTKNYPAARIRMLTYDHSYILHNKIATKECDIGLSAFEPPESEFIGQKFLDDPFVFICPREMKIGDVVTMRQFCELPLIIREEGCRAHELLLKNLAQKGRTLSNINVVWRVYDNAAILQAVDMGMGCGFVTKSLVCNTKVHDSSYKIVTIKNFKLERSLYLVRRKEMPFLPTIKAFWDFTCNTKWYSNLLSYAN
jgi:DNA-binding transcriptional LysR family regulator